MKPHKALDFTRTNTAVGNAALEDVGLLCALHNIYTILVFEVTNTGQALADFGLMVQPMHGASFHLMLDGVNWASASISIKRWVSVDLKTLASGSSGVGYVEIPPCKAIKFQAQAAAATTSVTILAAVYRGGA